MRIATPVTALDQGNAPEKQTPDQPNSDIDLLAFLPLVKSIAIGIHSRIPSYASVDLNDLIQAGLLGLVHAGKSYRQSRNVPFAVFARFRIRGEIIDTLRQSDVASRGLRRLDKQMKATEATLQAQLNREPTDSEVAERMAALNPSQRPAGRTEFLRLPPVTLTSFDQESAEIAAQEGHEPTPDSFHSAEEARRILDQAIAQLPARSRELIRLYYHGELTMREIGAFFQVNESRVSQIHRRALERLGRSLKAVGIESAREI
ncbi:sigma-70 family RNA polymerase sigma factor [Nevskia soli]|jgi:RNA polymerase sigma factor for flagellar operon FliA|uniref:sigma-70 family RNA polymerase sigma factor n=1 Tax=Nevskia soli TaxID=418856 RepID=UPI0015D8D9D9|nr:sigma-70 family RNA polymerase sigma factor [Nevskia soli]